MAWTMPGPQPEPYEDPARIRVLFVFAWLVVGGEETEVRHLARLLPRDRYRLDVVACFRKPGMPEQTHDQLRALGVRVDTEPYALSFEDTVAYLARLLPRYDVVVSCQNVADIYPALERLHLRPPLIEHGGLVSEAEAGPKHLTARYVGVCETIRAAAAARMPGREGHAVAIPSMVDLREFDLARRAPMRAALGYGPADLVLGWVGRLDRKKRVEDVIDAALLCRDVRGLRLLIVGGPDAFMPDYADALRARAAPLGARVTFTGDRADVPDLLAAMDLFAWVSRGEGMPHVIAEAGAACLSVIATPDNGALEQVTDGVTGLLVPHEDPVALAAAVRRLAADPALRARLGVSLRAHVEASYAADVVVPRWLALFDEVLAEVPPAPPPSVFASPLMGGWECSTHRRPDGVRLDVIAATGHDRAAAQDYAQLRDLGLVSQRDGLRWPLIERTAGSYDWSSWTPMLEAARDAGVQVIWDLLHYGWPDGPGGVDPFAPGFPARFAAFARAAAKERRRVDPGPVPWWCPVNEISFLSWAGGDAAYLNPFARGRGFELKVALARATLAAQDRLREVDPRARFITAEPLIAIHHDPSLGGRREEAEGWHEAQFQAFDLLAGRIWPQAGGHEAALDVVGVNYYVNNQWIHGGPTIDADHPLHVPLSDLLMAVHARTGRPVLVAETGTEGDRRGPWLDHVLSEVARARRRGVPVEGVCLYPVADHPGWDDERECPNGLLGMRPGPSGRAVHAPLAQVLSRGAAVLTAGGDGIGSGRPSLHRRPDARTLVPRAQSRT